MKTESFTTSWSSQIAPCIQVRVVRRIRAGDDIYTIMNEEIRDILDDHPEIQEEVWEIFHHCEDIANNQS